jgi:hypothetical protein
MKVFLWALATGAVVSLPAALMPFQRDFYRRHFPQEAESWTNNGTFSLLDTFHMAEDTYPYAARIREAGTHALPGDPYIRENRSRRLIVRDFLTFELLGGLYRAAGDLRKLWAVLYFLFPVLWVLLLYQVMIELGARKEAALFTAVVSTVFEDLTRTLAGFDPKAAVQYAFWLMGSYQHWLGPTRVIRPLVVYPFLFAAAIAFSWACKRRTLPAALVAGLAGGALAYAHPDVWAAFMGAGALFAAHEIWRDRKLSAFTAIMAGAAAALSAPWLYLNLAGHESVSLASRAVRSVDPWALVYAAAAWLTWRKWRENSAALWTAGLLATVALGLNAQLLGFQSDTGSWVYLGNTFLVLLAGRWLHARPWNWRWMTACALLLALPRALSYSLTHYKVYALPKAQEEAFDWLSLHTPKDSVVAALSPMTNARLPVHTHNKTLVSLIFPLTSDISTAENADRLATALGLYGAGAEAFAKECLNRSSDWEKKLWVGQVDEAGRERSGTCLRYFMTEESAFEELLRKGSPRKDFAVNYLWLGPFEKKLAKKIAGKKVFENDSIAILAL